MKIFFEKLALILGITVALVYLLFLVLPFIVSPILKNYVPQINDEIKKSTGLVSRIEDLKVVTTPKLTFGVKVGEFKLETPDNKEIAQIEDFQVKMSLLPLLAKKIEVDLVKADDIEATINLNKDGSFEIEKYLPKTEETAQQEEVSESFALPFNLKLSNHLPDIRIADYDIKFVDLSTGQTYVLDGDKIEITDFVLDKHVKVLAKGKMLLQRREQFNYDIKVNNKIMPELELNELVFNPQSQEQKQEEVNINILDILKGLYNNQITANIKTDIMTNKNCEHFDFRGVANFDNLSVAPNGLKLPPSDIKLKFKGSKIDVNSNFYTAQNEVSTLNGFVETGKNTKVDLNFKSKAELNNLVKILNAIAVTFNIKDLQTLTANGKIDADFNIKSDMKKVNSNGYLKIPSAKVYYGLYNIGINDINADIALNNNNIDIKNIGFSVLSQPLRLFGTIKQDAMADLHLTSQNLNLKGLLLALGQGALLKDNQINSGTVSLKADVVGKLDKIKPTANVLLSNINLKNIPANTVLSLPKTNLNIVSDGKTFSGNILASDVKVINPAVIVNVPNLKTNIKEDVIEITPTSLTADKIKLVLSGKIKNYLTPKISMDFATSGDINSTLNGDMNLTKQTLNLVFSAPQDNKIIIPMFSKSKMIFRGNTTITGNMMNPVLNGKFDIPVIDMPEIPMTMNNTVVNLNGAILNGKATVSKFTSGGIVAENILTDFSMKGEKFYLKNMTGKAYDGNISGNIIYNMVNAKTSVDMKGAGLNAEKTVAGAVGIKNAMTGTLDFNTNLTLTVADYNDMMRSMKGFLTFDVKKGAFGKIGRLENLLNANNIVTNSILKTTVATVSTLTGIKDTAIFDYISGNVTFGSGWANISYIKSSGKTLAYYVTGKYNLVNGTTNVNILGRLDGKVVGLLGPLGDLSAAKIVSFIPKIGSATSSVIKALTTNPKTEKISLIPALSSGSTNYKDFKVVFNGGLESTSSVKSFKWLSNPDTTAIEKVDIVDTVKSLKTSVNKDYTNTVDNAKKVIESVKTQKEVIRNSANEIKNLFKF